MLIIFWFFNGWFFYLIFCCFSSWKESEKHLSLPLYFLHLSPHTRPWFVLHQESGGGQRGARSGGEDSGPAAGRRELGPQRLQADLAVWKQPLAHHHRQIRPVPGIQLPGEPAGRHFPLRQLLGRHIQYVLSGLCGQTLAGVIMSAIKKISLGKE